MASRSILAVGGTMAATLGLLCASPVFAQQAGPADGVAVTIYSTAQPGAIPPELYRPTPDNPHMGRQAVPGYAVVRQDRQIQIGK